MMVWRKVEQTNVLPLMPLNIESEGLKQDREVKQCNIGAMIDEVFARKMQEIVRGNTRAGKQKALQCFSKVKLMKLKPKGILRRLPVSG